MGCFAGISLNLPRLERFRISKMGNTEWWFPFLKAVTCFDTKSILLRTDLDFCSAGKMNMSFSKPIDKHRCVHII